jgi:hypothetical protein
LERFVAVAFNGVGGSGRVFEFGSRLIDTPSPGAGMRGPDVSGGLLTILRSFHPFRSCGVFAFVRVAVTDFGLSAAGGDGRSPLGGGLSPPFLIFPSFSRTGMS